ncbi:type II toxin-antitoxin system RelE/ParE family toxin [Geomonas oryzae]|uniref:type II toxin-antitoxin system RelE/ParE family toxin n=1 Tax=Geomonas oryzae TaxID=2364273 RepID=UPI001FEA4B85|nr:type II toxin-antitoxin system RelE/ParE family toxin [Geomonas oryzae]
MTKGIEFLGDSLEVIKGFPQETRVSMGHALHVAQDGGKVLYAKPLKGLGGGATVIEICDDCDGNTFRVMYTVKIGSKVFVLHAFQKKSKKGIETPKTELEIVKARLKKAKELAER